MSEVSSAPDIAGLEIPMDAWTEPFWQATEVKRLFLPRCLDCRRFRWPPGPFCPHCQSQSVEWRHPGAGFVYSFTLVRSKTDAHADRVFAPALVEFPEADGVRMLAAIVDAPIEQIRIGAPLNLRWAKTANVMVPIFALASH